MLAKKNLIFLAWQLVFGKIAKDIEDGKHRYT
jgi:hypothetical protein